MSTRGRASEVYHVCPRDTKTKLSRPACHQAGMRSSIDSGESPVNLNGFVLRLARAAEGNPAAFVISGFRDCECVFAISGDVCLHSLIIAYTKYPLGVSQLEESSVRNRDAAGSNPASQTVGSIPTKRQNHTQTRRAKPLRFFARRS